MFISKRRPVIFPQSEHARLAGTIAFHWGNEFFASPPLPFRPFVTGVTLHDRGYDPFDTAPLPDNDEERWLKHQHQGATRSSGDKLVDVLVKLHVKRLLGYRPTPERDLLATEIDRLIDADLKALGLSREPFEWCDRITHFCDNVAFDFCFEEPKSGAVEVFSATENTAAIELTYKIEAEGQVHIDPWPLNCPELDTFILCYPQESYPTPEKGIVTPVHIRPLKG